MISVAAATLMPAAMVTYPVMFNQAVTQADFLREAAHLAVELLRVSQPPQILDVLLHKLGARRLFAAGIMEVDHPPPFCFITSLMLTGLPCCRLLSSAPSINAKISKVSSSRRLLQCWACGERYAPIRAPLLIALFQGNAAAFSWLNAVGQLFSVPR